MERDGITRVYTFNKDPNDPVMREVFPSPSEVYAEGVKTGDEACQVAVSCDALGESVRTGRWAENGRPDFTNGSVTWSVRPYDGAGRPSGDMFEVEGVIGSGHENYGRLASETERHLGRTGLTIIIF